MQLIITNNDNTEALRMEIGDVNPQAATVAIINALETIKKPRRIRSDAGKTRAATQS